MPLGDYQANCYILTDEATGEIAVIDPGYPSKELISELDKCGSNVKYILLTHGHADHTGAVLELTTKYNCSVYINKLDADTMKSGNFIFGGFNFDERRVNYINDTSIFTLGESEIITIETPGHSTGGVCFYSEGMLFTGDTLFYGSIGRTDFIGGDFDTLINSIKNKLFLLEDETIVYPGHGIQSSIKWEKLRNPYLKNRI